MDDAKHQNDASCHGRPVLSVVIVNYNGWDDVARLASGLAGSAEVASGQAEVIVVDNASDGPIPRIFQRPPQGVRLILRTHNGGFAAGVNTGRRDARGRWLLLLNPDVVAEPDLLGRILRRVRQFERRADGPPGIVGFGLRNDDGTAQPSVGYEPNLVRSLRGLFIPRNRRKYQASSHVAAGPVAVPWVTGACLLIDAELLDRIGGLDEDFFLYYEEVALCRAVRAHGRRVEFDPTVAVVHLRPLQSREVTPKLRVITRHSKLLYFRKHRPHAEFHSLAHIIAWEAGAKGFWSRLRGRHDHSHAWRTVARVARTLRRGGQIRGADVLKLYSARSAEASAQN